ncbi:MAG: phosphatidylinositol mannoside acyltransferase [Acidimicrobiia bacterium]
MSRFDGLGTYALFRLSAGVLSLFPEPVARRTGEGLGWAGSFVAPGRLALVRRHLARVVGEEEATTRRARRMFASYGRYWAEVFWVTPRRVTDILATSRLINAERLEAAAQSGRGVILALPHTGNWESAGAASASHGAPVLAVAEALPNRRLIEWFVDLRRKVGMEVVLADGDRQLTATLVRRLKGGGTIALVSDRDLSGRGVAVTFFGEQTTLPAGPATLAERTGAILLPVGCYFAPGRGNRFVIEEPIAVPDLPTREERVVATTQALAEVMEEVIRRAPEQWHLFQPNWPSDRAAR